MDAGPVRRADLDQLDALTSAAVSALDRSAVSVWLVADPVQRRNVLHSYLGVHLLHSIRAGNVWMVDHAVAVWTPCHQADGSPLAEQQPWLDLVTGRHVSRFRILEQQLYAHHAPAPHEHLTLLAVAGDRQRCGLGSRLVAHHLDHLSQASMSTRLTALSVGARRLFLRHGFHDVQGPADVPDGPRLWPMSATVTQRRRIRDLT